MDVQVVEHVPLAPSQNIATPEPLERDDEYEIEVGRAETNGDSHSKDDADNSTVHRPASTGLHPCQLYTASKKRRSAEPTSSEKKPRYQESSTMKVTALVSIDRVDVPCVFIDEEQGKKKTQVPIPLWGQYTVTWGAYDFGETKWIVIGNQECWMKRLVDVVQKKPVRQWAKVFKDRFAREFFERLEEARAPTKQMDDILGSSAWEKPSPKNRTARENESRVIEIKIDEFTLTCVNTVSRCLMRLDESTQRFIACWVAPLIKEMTPNMPLGELREVDERLPPLQRGSSSESLGDMFTFRMPANCTPNYREKVCWDPPRHAWKVTVKKLVDTHGKLLEIQIVKAASKGKLTKEYIEYIAVNPTQDVVLYEAEKMAKYWRAIQAWNDKDKSTRHRITTTSMPEELSIQ